MTMTTAQAALPAAAGPGGSDGPGGSGGSGGPGAQRPGCLAALKHVLPRLWPGRPHETAPAASAPNTAKDTDSAALSAEEAAAALIRQLSPRMAARVSCQDGELHLSAELRGNMALDSALAQVPAAAALPLVWHTPASFEQRFGLEAEANPVPAEAAPATPVAPTPGPAIDALEISPTWVDAYVHRLFRRAMARRASDIHITCMGPYAQVSFRRMGLMVEEETLDGQQGLQLVRGIFQGQLSQAEAGFSEYERYDGRIADRDFLPRGLFAVRLHSEPIQSPYQATPGVTLAMRLLFDATSARGTLSERLGALGFTPQQQEMIAGFAETTGMSIISGPTGHGKTTVLKNILEAQARSMPTRNYYSLEDPPEYTIQGVKQLNVFTKAVSDAERQRSLLEALAGLMRSDPDVILLGEIRYLETAKAAVNAALTGHSVWTTVHASSALNVLARLKEMGVPLSSLTAPGVITGVSYQRLLPVLCPHCKEPLMDVPHKLAPRLLDRLQGLFSPDALAGICVRGNGCPACDGLGLAGLQVAAEVIPLQDPGLVRLLARNRLAEAQEYWVQELGGMTHQAHARQRVLCGEVDPALCEERLGTTLDADVRN